MSVTPAGWYADPSNPSQQRYWDGAQWTEHVAVPSAPLVAPAAPPAPLYYPAEPVKKKLSGGAIAAIVVGSVVLVLFVGGILAAIAIPVFLDQSAQATDAAAKADVATLGKEIATYYVDNSGPVPPIEADGGYYEIDTGGGNFVGFPISEGVEFGSVEGTGPTDWCVWVFTTAGNESEFQYSAAGGLAPGSC